MLIREVMLIRNSKLGAVAQHLEPKIDYGVVVVKQSNRFISVCAVINSWVELITARALRRKYHTS